MKKKKCITKNILNTYILLCLILRDENVYQVFLSENTLIKSVKF